MGGKGVKSPSDAKSHYYVVKMDDFQPEFVKKRRNLSQRKKKGSFSFVSNAYCAVGKPRANPKCKGILGDIIIKVKNPKTFFSTLKNDIFASVACRA